MNSQKLKGKWLQLHLIKIKNYFDILVLCIILNYHAPHFLAWKNFIGIVKITYIFVTHLNLAKSFGFIGV